MFANDFFFCLLADRFLLRIVAFCDILITEVIVDLEECIGDVSMRIKQKRLQHLSQLDPLHALPRYAEHLLKRINALQVDLATLHYHSVALTDHLLLLLHLHLLSQHPLVVKLGFACGERLCVPGLEQFVIGGLLRQRMYF